MAVVVVMRVMEDGAHVPISVSEVSAELQLHYPSPALTRPCASVTLLT